MSTQEEQQTADEDQQSGQEGRKTEIPAPTEEDIERAKKGVEGMTDRYESEDRKTVVLPGSDGTISGTAINDWLDDDGNPIDQTKSDEDSKSDDVDKSNTADTSDEKA